MVSIFKIVFLLMVVFWTLVTSLLKRPDINSIKYWLQTRLGISKDQDQLTVKTDKLLRSADLLNRVDPIGISQVQGFLGYDFWDGGDCNGNKTFVQGMQTDFCTLHSSGNGSFKIQISDASCTTVVVAFYSDLFCAKYVGYHEVVDQQECLVYHPDTFMVSGKMRCVLGDTPVIGINSTVSSFYNTSDPNCFARPFEFIALRNSVNQDVSDYFFTDDALGSYIDSAHWMSEWLNCDVSGGEQNINNVTDPVCSLNSDHVINNCESTSLRECKIKADHVYVDEPAEDIVVYKRVTCSIVDDTVMLVSFTPLTASHTEKSGSDE